MVPTSKRTLSAVIRKKYKRLLLFSEVIAVHCRKSIFFFYWHYIPLRVLAFSVILFHSTLSSHCFLHRLIPILCISSSLSLIHLFLGLPPILLPLGLQSNILLDVPLSFIRITWPSQAILLLFINLTVSLLALILRGSRTGTVWFYTSTSNKRAARPKLYTKSLTKGLTAYV